MIHRFSLTSLGSGILAACSIALLQSPVEASEEYVPTMPKLLGTKSQNPDYADFALAYKQMTTNRFKVGGNRMRDGRAKFKDSFYFLYGCALYEYMDQEYEKAYPIINSALQKFPKNRDLSLLRAVVLAGDDRYQEALAIYTELLDLEPRNLELLRLRGYAYLQTCQFEKANADLNLALSISPAYKPGLYLRGEIAASDGNFKSAVIDYTNALGTGINDIQTYAQRAMAYARLFDFEKAKADTAKAQEISHFSYDSQFKRVDDYKCDYEHRETIMARRFLLAVGAPLAMQNRQGFLSVSGVRKSEADAMKVRASISKSWGISNRQELLAMIRRHTTGGHDESWRQLKNTQKILKGPPLAVKLQLKVLHPFEDMDSINSVVDYGDQLGSRGIIAWDLGRNVFLCRQGVRAGYINNNEALELMLLQAQLVQKNYKSWSQFVSEYYVGRKFWSPKTYEDEKFSNELRIRSYFKDPQSPFLQVPWDTKLTKETVFPKEQLPNGDVKAGVR